MLKLTNIDRLLENVKDINKFAYNIIKKNYSISIKEHDYIFNSNENKSSVPRLSKSYPTLYKKIRRINSYLERKLWSRKKKH